MSWWLSAEGINLFKNGPLIVVVASGIRCSDSFGKGWKIDLDHAARTIGNIFIELMLALQVRDASIDKKRCRASGQPLRIKAFKFNRLVAKVAGNAIFVNYDVVVTVAAAERLSIP
ncbi:hypothetical protein SAMN05880593_13263 [Rhizobium sp. RU36D]|nr:hypothetical protein SAMN05880593_13263 [Rhizobium sp. RU36D]